MNIELFSDLLLQRDYEGVERELKNGFDPNTPLEQSKTAIEWCSFSEDYRMIELLWKFGGKPTSPWTQEIINEFENGKTFEHFEQPIAELIDLTEIFSVEHLKFLQGRIEFDNKEYSIEIPVSAFMLDQKEIMTLIRLDNIVLPDSIDRLIGQDLKFPINPEPGYIDGSIYLRECHIPVDVTTLTFTNVDEGIVTAELEAHFVFQHENIGFSNESRRIKIVLDNKVNIQ